MQTRSLVKLLFFAGLLAPALFADAPKPEPAKKPCVAPPPVKSTTTPAPVAQPTFRDFFDPGFGRKSLDLSYASRRTSNSTPPKS